MVLALAVSTSGCDIGYRGWWISVVAVDKALM